MAYRVEQHPNQVRVIRNFRYTGFVMLTLGLALAFGAYVFQTKLLSQGDTGWLLITVNLIGGISCFAAATGLATLFINATLVIDYDSDTVTRSFPKKQVIPFQEIEELVVEKRPRPASRHLDKTLGENLSEHWILYLATDQGRIPVMDAYSELDVRRFITEINKGAEWPVRHVEIANS